MKTFKIFVQTCVFLTFISVFGQQLNVSGMVTSNEIPIPGVNVIVKGSNSGTTTDFDGNYNISCNSTDVLVFTYIGLKPRKFLWDPIRS